jgi:electron transfer flavoprotein beta subunit
MAEHLDMPHVCYVNEIRAIKDNRVTLRRIMDDGVEVLEVPLPLLITVSKDINNPRLATLRGRLKAKKAEIKEITNEELKLDPEEIGLEGSFTRVVKIFEPEEPEPGEIIEGSPEELAEAIFSRLREFKVI